MPDPVIVGRETEIRELNSFLETASSFDPSLIISPPRLAPRPEPRLR